MTSPETLYTKTVVNELSFLLVTHTTCFDTRFDRYEFFEVRFQHWTDSGQTGYTGAWSDFWASRCVILAGVYIQHLKITCSAF
jgi:hypothetical protein